MNYTKTITPLKKLRELVITLKGAKVLGEKRVSLSIKELTRMVDELILVRTNQQVWITVTDCASKPKKNCLVWALWSNGHVNLSNCIVYSTTTIFRNPQGKDEHLPGVGSVVKYIIVEQPSHD